MRAVGIAFTTLLFCWMTAGHADTVRGFFEDASLDWNGNQTIRMQLAHVAHRDVDTQYVEFVLSEPPTTDSHTSYSSRNLFGRSDLKLWEQRSHEMRHTWGWKSYERGLGFPWKYYVNHVRDEGRDVLTNTVPTIDLHPVPIPPAAFLFISALVFVVGVGVRRMLRA